MRKKLIMGLIIVALIPLSYIHVQAQPQITTFTPTAGWPGTDFFNGTRVRILGSGFRAEPTENRVFFNGTQGSLVQAEIAVSFADESLYEFARTIGSPGTDPGELNSPRGAAVDGKGKVYVANYLNQRVEVFHKSGQYSHQLAQGLMETVVGIAFDETHQTVYICGQKYEGGNIKGYVYGLSPETGSVKTSFSLGIDVNPYGITVDEENDEVYVLAYTDWIKKYTASGQYLMSLKTPGFGIGMATQLAFDQARKILYIATSNFVLRYINGIYDDIFPTPGTLEYEGVAVDQDGYVYVSTWVGSDIKVLRKYDPDGQFISEFGDPTDFSPGSGPPITVDVYKRLYAVDWQNDYIRVYAPRESGELIVTVPPDAATGPITVETMASDSTTSTASFTVLDSSEPVSVTEVDVTQGIASYPFVVQKDTVVFAKFDGLFGDPANDVATVAVRKDSPIALVYPFDHFEWDFTKKKTVGYYRVPENFIRSPGVYEFSIEIKRKGQDLIPVDEKVKQRVFNTTKDVYLYFVKFTDVKDELWGQQDPFPWFDMRTFLYGLDTFKRTYPVGRKGVHYRFGGGMYFDFLEDLSQEADETELLWEGHLIYNKSTNSSFPITRIVGILGSELRDTGNWGVSSYNKERALTYFGKGDFKSGPGTTWGFYLSHEIGHTYGLVSDGQENSNGDHHSVNYTLENEDDGPVTAWNPMTDELLDPDETIAMMNPFSGAQDDQTFFESRFQGKAVDYPVLYDKLKTSSVSLSSGSWSTPVLSPLSDSRKFVISGLIDSDNTVSRTESFLTMEALPLTPAEPSDYALVFLNETGQVLSQDGFLLTFPVQAGEGGIGRGVFEAVRPYPDSTRKVEIRFQGQTLISLVPSENPPFLGAVTVQTQEFQPVVIQWEAGDTDGDPLNYSVLYSTDGGENFTAIGVDLMGSRFVWDDSLCPGSDNALIRVVANDGFHTVSADSAGFYLRKKKPKVAILAPAQGSQFTEDSTILLRGAAFDPEDGTLSGESLTWTLDENVALGTGETVMIHELPRRIPLGFIPMPLEIGSHSVRLTVTDSEGNESSADLTIEIVADSDRDGFSDQDENAFGGDPFDPFARPVDLDEDDDGLLVTTEDADRDGQVGPGETDPKDPDTDHDGLLDALELGRAVPESGDTDLSAGFFSPDMDPTTQTDPGNPDSDGDTLMDGDEDRNQNGMVDSGETDPNNPDTDRDERRDDQDNCPVDPNPSQADFDGDLIGDVCDPDDDNDGVFDQNDRCPYTALGEVADADGCSINQLCPCSEPWKNHGKYVSCVAKTAERFLEEGVISEQEKDLVVSEAARSTCGKRPKK